MTKQLRHLENLHIPLWLIKDTCWMMQWKTVGISMVLPTLAVAVYICIITRQSPLRFWPNVAVTFWLSANSTWMLGEFFGFNFQKVALSGFAAGMLAMTIFLVMYLKTERNQF
jgi:hypothetical protein